MFLRIRHSLTSFCTLYDLTTLKYLKDYSDLLFPFSPLLCDRATVFVPDCPHLTHTSPHAAPILCFVSDTLTDANSLSCILLHSRENLPKKICTEPFSLDALCVLSFIFRLLHSLVRSATSWWPGKHCHFCKMSIYGRHLTDIEFTCDYGVWMSIKNFCF